VSEFPALPTCHCHPSSLDTASTIEEFFKREHQLGTGYLTVTDHGSLGACRAVWDLAKKGAKVKVDGKDVKLGPLTPVLGLEGYFFDPACPILAAAGVADPKKWWSYGHVTLGFLDQEAYEVATRVLSRAPMERHGQEMKPLFNWADMEEILAKNATITTSCLGGMVARHLVDHDAPRVATAYYDRLKALARPGNFYVEVGPHVCDRYWDKGVYVKVAKPDGSEEELKFWMGKKLKTDGSDELTAEALAAEYSRGSHKSLLAIKDRQAWVEREGGGEILSVRRVEEFIVNECRPWSPNGDLQAGVNRFVLELARRKGDPVVVGDDSHYALPEDDQIHDARLMSGGGSWRFWGNYARKSAAETYEVFRDTIGTPPEQFRRWCEDTRAWAERFKAFEWKTAPQLPTKFYPSDTLGYLNGLIEKHGRRDPSDAWENERLATEIKLLHDNGIIDLLPYFFPGEEAVEEYTKRGQITGVGRGSAAGVLLPYLIGVTHVHPKKYDLSLERFITEDRIKDGAFPDLDQDLPDQEIVAEWLQRRYGDHQARISTDTQLRIRSACKDAARAALKHVPEEVEQLTKKFAKPPQGVTDFNFVFGYEDSGNRVPGSIEYDEALREFVAKYPDLWRVAVKMMGITRSKSQHPCAWIIGNRPISEWIPMTLVSGSPVTAYTPASVEAVGGVKYDFLSVNTLKDISACNAMVQSMARDQIPEGGIVIDGKLVPRPRVVPLPGGGLADCWDLPVEDAVMRDIVEGRVETVFQFNADTAKKWMRVFLGDGPEDVQKAVDGGIMFLAAFTALDRPGTLKYEVTNPETGDKHNILVEYARRLQGKPRSPDILPVFDEIAPKTQGLMVFQESLQYAYQHLTGCTLSEAEAFRRDVAKKKKEKILARYEGFLQKAGAKIGAENAKAVWDAFAPWAEYGFNKSHAICYAITGYTCAWLKHHYPLQWWCAVLKNATKDDVQGKFWRHVGHLVDLPDVSLSASEFEVQAGRIRAPLSLLRGIAEKSHEELLAGAPYASIVDFCDKIKARKDATSEVVDKKDEKTGEVKKVKRAGRSALNRGVVYTLIVSGAMDSLFEPGSTALEKLAKFEEELARSHGKKKAEAVKKEFVQLDPLVLYQHRKAILPAYSADLREAVWRSGLTSIALPTGHRPTWTRGHVRAPFASGAEAERLANITPYPSGKDTTVAVAAYVQDAALKGWGPNKSKPLMELTLDVGGTYMKLAKFPDRGEKGLPPWCTVAKLKGAVVVLAASKYRDGKPPSVAAVEVVRPPLTHKEKEEE
jgi:DNA polymerase III alpha subunit